MNLYFQNEKSQKRELKTKSIKKSNFMLNANGFHIRSSFSFFLIFINLKIIKSAFDMNSQVIAEEIFKALKGIRKNDFDSFLEN
jgi:hypothetical protein